MTVTVNNETVRSRNSIADNPRLEYYNLVYGLTLLIWLVLFILRTYVFVFVSAVLLRVVASNVASLFRTVFVRKQFKGPQRVVRVSVRIMCMEARHECVWLLVL